MGRLTDNTPGTEKSPLPFDQNRFLAEAGELTEKLHRELLDVALGRSPSGETGTPGRRGVGTQSPGTRSASGPVASPDQPPGLRQADESVPDEDRSAETHTQSDAPEEKSPPPRPLRIFTAPEEAGADTIPTGVDAGTETGIDHGQSADDGLPDPLEPVDAALPEVSRAPAVPAGNTAELQAEQQRWTERHARQSRLLEEQGDRLTQWAASLQDLEHRLSSREQALERRARELARQIETDLASVASRNEERAGIELARRAAEAEAQTGRARRLETELTALREAHAREISRLSEQLEQCEQSRTMRCRRVIEECDLRLAELAEEKRLASSELAAERRRNAEELATARSTFDIQQSEREQKLAAEQRVWKESLAAEVQRMETERAAHDQALTKAREELARLAGQQWKYLEQLRADAERLEDEQRASREQLEATRQKIENERAVWHRERSREASILQHERNDLDEERRALEADRDQLLLDLEQQRQDHEETLRRERENHQQSLELSERDLATREQMFHSRLAQQDAELRARREQFEHELLAARALHEKRAARERQAFEDECIRRQTALERDSGEVQQARQAFEQERRRFAEDMNRQRQQFDQERGLFRDSIQQLDEQLQWLGVTDASTVVRQPQPPALIPEESGQRRPLPRHRTASSPPVPMPHFLAPTFPSREPAETRVRALKRRNAEESAEALHTDGWSGSGSTMPDELDSDHSDHDATDTVDSDTVLQGEPSEIHGGQPSFSYREDQDADSGGLSALSRTPGGFEPPDGEPHSRDSETGSHAGWAGIVSARDDSDSLPSADTQAPAQEPTARQQALEQYRLRLAALQSQLKDVRDMAGSEWTAARLAGDADTSEEAGQPAAGDAGDADTRSDES